MRELDSFSKLEGLLQTVDYSVAKRDSIYRLGIVSVFDDAFENAWKALHAALKIQGKEDESRETPMEILRKGNQFGYIKNFHLWHQMIEECRKYRSIHDDGGIEVVEGMLSLIQDSFIPALISLERKLREELKEAHCIE